MAQGEEKATTSREGRRGREARRAQRLQARASSVPWIQRRVPTTEILPPDAIATIEANAERLLEEVGIEFRDYPSALARFRDAGCDVQGVRVRFPRGLARKLASTAPREYVQVARNPARSVRIGGDGLVFAPVYGSPFVHDLDRGLSSECRYHSLKVTNSRLSCVSVDDV